MPHPDPSYNSNTEQFTFSSTPEWSHKTVIHVRTGGHKNLDAHRSFKKCHEPTKTTNWDRTTKRNGSLLTFFKPQASSTIKSLHSFVSTPFPIWAHHCNVCQLPHRLLPIGACNQPVLLALIQLPARWSLQLVQESLMSQTLYQMKTR